MRSWSDILKEAERFRHELHAHPELSWEEHQTAEKVRHRLDDLQIPWRVCAELGTVATLAPKAKGPHIALRADMDALPIKESTQLPYQSTIEGCMHACGHDGHTAVLWATAAWLKQYEDQLPGPVSLLFQPAEEGGHGAQKMVEDGALEGVDEVYGWHNWPAIPYGQAVCPDGPVMSGNGTFSIDILGKGGHASQPELCQDPVIAAAAITLNLQQIISRRLAPQSAAVVNVSSIIADAAPTVIPETATISGSIRLSDPSLRPTMKALIQQISEDTARTYGVKVNVDIQDRYDATINHAAQAHKYRQALQEEFDQELGQSEAAWQPESFALPIMASEDFSYYLQAKPGAFALIGMSKAGQFTHACHSPHYQFNDDLLPPVVRVYARLVGAPLP